MSNQSSFYNHDLEKALVAGLLQYPEIYPSIAIVKSTDLSQINNTVYEVITNTIENKGTPTALVVAERLKAVGLSDIGGVEVIDYLNGLNVVPVSKKDIISVAKEVKKLSVARNIHARAVKLQKQMIELKNGPASEMFKAVDEAFGSSLTTLDTDTQEAINLYEEMPRLILERGNNPIKNAGYATPYPIFNKLYSGLRPKNLYIWASRSGQGKSTFLLNTLDLAIHKCNPEEELFGLYLDTEMDEQDQMFRLAASRVNCPYFLVETGQWANRQEWRGKIIKEMDRIQKLKDKRLFFHKAGNMNMSDLKNFVKNFYYRKLGRGKKMMLAYDYLKILAADGVGKGVGEWQLALDKAQILKDLAEEIDAPVLSALQVNRSGVTTNKDPEDIIDDESVIALSDRVGWLVAFMGILRRKVPEEVAKEGVEWGTHKLIPTKSRYQGEEGHGHLDLVKTPEGRWKANYINFDFNNFEVTEKGCLRDWIKATGGGKVGPSGDNKNDFL